ncbi:MAG: YeeE/YedE family protein, partial [Calditrichaeota bacterium]|nr:YeeE/YedE family protein [Calditrichota bacterium]
GGLNRILVFVQDLIVPAHVDRTPYLLSMAGGEKNALDNSIVWITVGTLLGGFLSGWLNRRLRWETRRGPRIGVRTRWMLALAGGVLMGYGARFARGCTSGQALSGGAVLSVGSWAFMLAVFAGGYLLAWFFRKAWN